MSQSKCRETLLFFFSFYTITQAIICTVVQSLAPAFYLRPHFASVHIQQFKYTSGNKSQPSGLTKAWLRHCDKQCCIKLAVFDPPLNLSNHEAINGVFTACHPSTVLWATKDVNKIPLVHPSAQNIGYAQTKIWQVSLLSHVVWFCALCDNKIEMLPISFHNPKHNITQEIFGFVEFTNHVSTNSTHAGHI